MTFIRSLTMKAKLTLLAAVFAVGFLIFGAVSFATLNTVKVNGSQYQRIVQNKDLLADVLPPPAYIVETYLVAQLMNGAQTPDQLEEQIARYETLKTEFQARQEYWRRTLPDSELKVEMVEKAREPAHDFFKLLDQELIPALRNKDKAAANTIVQSKLPALFARHRLAIDSVVKQTNAQAAANETQVASMISWRAGFQLLLGLGMLGLVTSFTFWLRNLAGRREALDVDSANQLTAIGAAFAVIEFEPDGTILTANENFLNAVGYSLHEIKGKHHRMFVSEDYGRSNEYRDFWARLGRGESQAGEFQRVGKGGAVIWIQARYSALVDAAGKIYKVVKYASDITAAVKARSDAAQKSAIIENVPINIMLANNEGTIVYINPASRKTLKSIEHNLPVKVDSIVGGSYDVFHKMPAHQRKLLADPKNLPHTAEIKVGTDTLSLSASAIYDANGAYFGPMVSWEVITAKKESERRERDNQERERAQQEDLRQKVDELLTVVSAAANGDLTREVTVTGDDAIGELAGGLRRMLADLRDVISQVVEGSAQFTEGSRVVSESAQTLAQGAQTQSASVEQMSASIEELTRSIEAVKENASSANTVAKETSSLAEEGGAAVKKSIDAMARIKTSSSQISEIIQVISEIASQTNLLALNADIEAARAGEHGLGFAVVADEVRKLAERSSEAAKEISKLIKESTQRVEEGAQLSEQTGGSLTKIILGVEATAKRIGEIAGATVEQAQNANEVSNAIQQVSRVTEQSAAGSEEMASSSEELGAQAAALRDLVSRFQVEAADARPTNAGKVELAGKRGAPVAQRPATQQA